MECRVTRCASLQRVVTRAIGVSHATRFHCRRASSSARLTAQVGLHLKNGEQIREWFKQI